MRFLFLAIAAALLVSGCAGLKAPGPLLPAGERERVVAAFSRFAAEQGKCPAGIEAGFSGEISAGNRRMPVSGEIRMRAPADASLTAVDPLGRPALIAAAENGRFTVVNVPEAAVYTGRLDGARVKEILPAPVGREMFYFLAGMLPPGRLSVRGAYASGRAGLFYIDFTLAGEDGFVHEVLFDPGRKRIVSHALLDGDGDRVFFLEYGAAGTGCIAAEVRASAAGAWFSLRLDGISQLSGSDFSLSWPPMFRVVEVR